MKLRYDKHKYGPYADNLNHALQRIEGHYIRGYGDRSREADMYVLPEGREAAQTFLETELVANVNLPLITRDQEHNERIAIATTEGAFTYRDLLHTSGQMAIAFLKDAEDLQEQRVAYLIPPGFQYVATQWGGFGALAA